MSLFDTKLDAKQFSQLVFLLTSLGGSLERLVESVDGGFERVAKAIKHSRPPHLEVKFMFVVQDNHPDVNFTLVLGDVTDAEGNVIADAALDITVESDNPTAVAVTFDAATKAGSVSFGSPGQANVVANVSSGGTLLGTGAAAFTVTTGNPAAISGVTLTFDGITEV